MNKKQIQDLNYRLIDIQQEFEDLVEKTKILRDFLYRTEPKERGCRTLRYPEIYGEAIYREAVKLAELFYEKYGNLIPKDEV